MPFFRSPNCVEISRLSPLRGIPLALHRKVMECHVSSDDTSLFSARACVPMIYVPFRLPHSRHSFEFERLAGLCVLNFSRVDDLHKILCDKKKRDTRVCERRIFIAILCNAKLFPFAQFASIAQRSFEIRIRFCLQIAKTLCSSLHEVASLSSNCSLRSFILTRVLQPFTSSPCDKSSKPFKLKEKSSYLTHIHSKWTQSQQRPRKSPHRITGVAQNALQKNFRYGWRVFWEVANSEKSLSRLHAFVVGAASGKGIGGRREATGDGRKSIISVKIGR